MTLKEKTSVADSKLQRMVETHYDSTLLMALRGEIHFDDELSEAEVQAAERVLQEVSGRGFDQRVYLPCAGTLRHVPPLIARGVQTIVAVDLSKESLKAGIKRYGEIADGRVRVHHADVRDLTEFAQREGFEQAILLGNSLGDVTDPTGHRDFVQALSDAMRPRGVLVFDYVGDRYNPPDGNMVTSAWPDMLSMNGRGIPVVDTRSRQLTHPGDDMDVLRFFCELTNQETGLRLNAHGYEKLTVPDATLTDQFAQAGMRLLNLGPIAHWSAYHRNRIEKTDDLGMMGKPNHLYAAIKERV